MIQAEGSNECNLTTSTDTTSEDIQQSPKVRKRFANLFTLRLPTLRN
jgi:hypothetical protein